MRLYLSSYKIWNKSEELKSMLQWLPKIVLYIANSIDYRDDAHQATSRREETFTEFQRRWYEVRELDLRDYFNKQKILVKEITNCWLLRVRWWNTFVLRQAMFLSGFDNIIKKLRKENYPLIYWWYSAWCCVLSKSLIWLEIVDQPEIQCYSKTLKSMRDGLWIIDYLFLPHYKSNHPESKLIDKTVDHCINKWIIYKTIIDWEVIIV